MNYAPIIKGGGKNSSNSITRATIKSLQVGAGGVNSSRNIDVRDGLISHSTTSLNLAKSVRNKSYSTTTQKKEFKPQLPPNTLSKRQSNIEQRFIKKKSRGSIQGMPEEVKAPADKAGLTSVDDGT